MGAWSYVSRSTRVFEGSCNGERRRASGSARRPCPRRGLRAAPRRRTSPPSSRCSAACCCPRTRSPTSSRSMRGHDFYRPAHEIVYEAILDLYGRGEPADAVTVSAELQKRGELGRVGGAPYLHTLISSVPTAANAGYYAEIVRERAILRRLVEAGTAIVQLGYAGDGDADDIVDRRAGRGLRGHRAPHLRGLPAARRRSWRAPSTRSRRSAPAAARWSACRPGFADLDELTNGLHPGQMIVVAARPAIGKALALDTPLPTPTGWTTMGEVAVGDELIGADGTPDPRRRRHRGDDGPALLRGRVLRRLGHRRRRRSTSGLTTTRVARRAASAQSGSPRRGRRVDACGPSPARRGDPTTSHRDRAAARPRRRHRGHGRSPPPDLPVAAVRARCGSARPFDLPDADLPTAVPTRSSTWLGDGDSRRSRQRRCGSMRCARREAHPAVYLRASGRQRRDLLAGLLDTDGTVNATGCVQIDADQPPSGRRRARTDARRSATRPVPNRNGRRTQRSRRRPAYRLAFTPDDEVFRLDRKLERAARSSTRPTAAACVVDVRRIASRAGALRRGRQRRPPLPRGPLDDPDPQLDARARHRPVGGDQAQLDVGASSRWR